MPKFRPPYPAEFRQQLIELVRAGHTPEELEKQFEPRAQTIRNWVSQADRDAGNRHDGLTSAEREELTRLRRENRQLTLEREIIGNSRGLVCTGDRCDPRQGFEFVSANQARCPVALMCRWL